MRLSLTVVILALASVAAPQGNTEVQPKPGDTVAPYTVLPGDTLQAITQKFLGDASLWPENQRLNPEVKDPHALRIGSRLRIITARTPLSRTAEVVLIAKRVEEKPATSDWRPSRTGNLLREREGLRTGKDSSSALQFDDGTRMNLGEDSLVFLREATSTLAGRKKQSLEVMEGQADLNSRVARGAPRSDIQVLVGGAVLRPATDSGGEGAVRARRGTAGDASVMVFGGKARVDAGGASVMVPKGMGTSVPKAGPPRLPEPLLPAPLAESPRIDESFNFGNPTFVWAPVSRAATYTLEICADPGCERLEARVTGLREPRHRVSRLQKGLHYWRAMAVSAGRLDGYPSTPRRLTIAKDLIDVSPPVIEAKVEGFWTPDAGGNVCATEATRVALEATDDAAGVADVRYRWNRTGEWKKYGPGAFEIPLFAGPQVVEFQATDLLGRQSKVGTMNVQLGAVECCSPRRVRCGGTDTFR